MQQQNQRLFKKINLALEIALVLVVISGLSWYLGKGQEKQLGLIGALTLGGLGAVLIWFRPWLGLTVAAASLALENILPSIPLATSLTSMLGGLALVAFVYQRKGYRLFSHGLQPQLLLAGLFLVWQFICYPRASFFDDERNWMFTFFQLLILLWLASELLTPERQHFTMRVFIAASVASALYAYSEAHLVEEFSYAYGLNRGVGFADDQNSLALYLSTAFVFAVYLHRRSTSRWSNLIYPPVYVALIMGVVGTVSRAGFLTLVLTLLLLAVFWMSNGRIKDRRRIIIPVLTLAFAAVYLVPGIYWTIMENTIFSPEMKNEGNFGNRSALIEAGAEVWKDYPIQGVGIGRFREVSRFYLSSENYRVFRSVAHNLYITLLAETGLVGFLLFMGWIAASMIQLYLTMVRRDPVYSPLATMWMIVFIIFLFKGYTASTMHYDKLLWMMGGISMLLYRGAQAQEAEGRLEVVPGEA
jgi:O-antigen ligase